MLETCNFLFASIVKLKSASFPAGHAPLGAGFAIFVAAICPTCREKLWALRVPFLGAYFVPVFGFWGRSYRGLV